MHRHIYLRNVYLHPITFKESHFSFNMDVWPKRSEHTIGLTSSVLTNKVTAEIVDTSALLDENYKPNTKYKPKITVI